MSLENKYSLANEMRSASLGSFPLSPGIMDGHNAVASLYWYYRRHTLHEKTTIEVFDSADPEPPKLVIPPGHIRLTSIDGLNTTVWQKFIEISFLKRPKVNYLEQVKSLITANAKVDIKNFEGRIAGGKTRVVPGKVAPSLLRAFVFENRFPIKSVFFDWILYKMAYEMVLAQRNNFSEPWSAELKELALLWNKTFPEEPFTPTV